MESSGPWRSEQTILKIHPQHRPANCGTADSGTVLATSTCRATGWPLLPVGQRQVRHMVRRSADAGSTAHFRLYASDGTTCHAGNGRHIWYGHDRGQHTSFSGWPVLHDHTVRHHRQQLLAGGRHGHQTKSLPIEQAVRGISRADDADSIVRNAGLDKIVAFIEANAFAMQERALEATKELG